MTVLVTAGRDGLSNRGLADDAKAIEEKGKFKTLIFVFYHFFFFFF